MYQHGGFHNSGSLETLMDVSMHEYSAILTIKVVCAQ